MSLSITINNINDLTDTERAVLRMIVGDKQVTLTGPTATQRFIERLAGCGHSSSEEGRYMCDGCSDALAKIAAGATPFTSTSLRPFDGGESTTSPIRELAPAAPAAPVPASAELDSAGLPWDKRIHSSSRAKVADGTWRKLRGVDDVLVTSVEAELRAVQAIPAPQTHLTPETQDAAAPAELPPVPPAPTATLAEMQAKLAAAENPVPAPPAPATPAPLPVDLNAAGQPAMTFAELMKHVTPMLVAGKLPQDKLLAITAEFGLPHLAALGARPDLVEAVKARIDAEVGNGAA